VRSYVKLNPLTLIKILGPLLPGARLQKHLTDCAAHEVLFRTFEPYHPPLRISHVLGFSPLPSRTETGQKGEALGCKVTSRQPQPFGHFA